MKIWVCHALSKDMFGIFFWLTVDFLRANTWRDQKRCLYRIFHAANFCTLIKTASIQAMKKSFYAPVYRMKLALQNAQFASLFT